MARLDILFLCLLNLRYKKPSMITEFLKSKFSKIEWWPSWRSILVSQQCFYAARSCGQPLKPTIFVVVVSLVVIFWLWIMLATVGKPLGNLFVIFKCCCPSIATIAIANYFTSPVNFVIFCAAYGTARFNSPGNALARVQRVYEPAGLWNITFCTRWFWGF